MRTIGNFLGFILLGLGVIWVGQDYGVIPGSFLSYEVNIDHRGIIALSLAAVVLLAINLGAGGRAKR
jgi:hypothetical protein